MTARRLVIASFIFLLAPGLGLAESRTGASFLKIGVGARAMGMGSAVTALSNDATALYWNPAGLRGVSTRQLSATHTEWLTDIRYDNMIFAQPFKKTTWAGGVSYLSQGDMDRRGENRERQGSFQARDAAMSLGFAGPLSARSTYGLGVKMIEQKIDAAAARGWAVDAGLMRRQGAWSLGLAAQNIGPQMKFYDEGFNLPMSLAGGAAWHAKGGFQVGMDLRHEIHGGRTSISLGSEYWLMGKIALRGGYLAQGPSAASQISSDDDRSGMDSLGGVNMGLGLRLGAYQMDYALVPAGELGATQRLSLSAKF